MLRSIFVRCCGFALMLFGVALLGRPAEAAHLGMGCRVGEVRQGSAIVWTRITKTAERNWDGYRDPSKREPKVNEYIPSKIRVADREGEISGAPGQVRVLYSTNKDLSGASATDWASVKTERDFTQQFRLKGLKPGTKYYLKVEARDSAAASISASRSGSFLILFPRLVINHHFPFGDVSPTLSSFCFTF